MEYYGSAILGSFILIAGWIKAEKNMHDKKNEPMPWASYMSKQWDDIAFAVISALSLAFWREELYFLYVYFKEINEDTAIDFYYEFQHIYCAFLGFFGILIIKVLQQIGLIAVNKVQSLIKPTNGT